MNIFNPEHDLCLANGDANFVPPASALKFGEDCAGLTEWIEKSAGNEIVPWGWDAVLKRRLMKDGIPESMLPSDAAISEIRRLSHRRIAYDAGSYVNAFLPGFSVFLRPLSYVREVQDLDSVASVVDEFGDAVLKAPLSGSGKGLRWARRGELSGSDLGWCRNIISRQGSVMVEKRLDIVRDFAMLFHIDAAGVGFEGLSLFFNDNGIYKGNVLASDAYILSTLGRFVPETLMINAKKVLMSFLEKEFCGKYEGYVGVDMFIYRDPHQKSGTAYLLAPVVEINVRMTMGLLARRVFDRHISSFSDIASPVRDGQYAMSVEFSAVPGVLCGRKFNAALTEIKPSSCYAVAISRTGV